jgi:hypothetical protein
LVSPLIEAGTVFRVPESATPLDHTSILATVEHRWSLPALTRQDAVAPDVGAVLTLSDTRTADPLARGLGLLWVAAIYQRLAATRSGYDPPVYWFFGAFFVLVCFLFAYGLTVVYIVRNVRERARFIAEGCPADIDPRGYCRLGQRVVRAWRSLQARRSR